MRAFVGSRTWPFALSLCIAFTFPSVSLFYLPGVAPVDYEDGSYVELKVNKLTSVHTQLPFEYYSLPFCRPSQIVQSMENLGEVLYGDKIETSNYEIHMRTKEKCKHLCTMNYNKAEIAKFASSIKQQYRVHWLIDGLPVASPVFIQKSSAHEPVKTYVLGFPLGYEDKTPEGEGTEQYLHNHVTMKIMYHTETDEYRTTSRVVGAEVFPASIQHVSQGGADAKVQCTSTQRLPPQSARHPATISWTYDVVWEESPVKWASRWDIYLMVVDSKIHWFSIINSILVILILSGVIAVILKRMLSQDILKYEDLGSTLDLESMPTWKGLHNQIFRSPSNLSLLCAILGTGSQVLGMCFITLLVAVLGFLSPANRGALIYSALVFYVLMGCVAGYVSSRLYRFFLGNQWKRTTILTATLFPGIVFGVIVFLNSFIWYQQSTSAMPLTTFAILMAMWIGVSLPLVFTGSYIGSTQEVIQPPVVVAKDERSVPHQPLILRPIVTCALSGLIPFGAVFVELFFIMTSIWQHQFYYLFGVVFVVFILVLLTGAEVAIVLCYLQLSHGDYRWMWRAIVHASGCSFYLIVYSAYFYTSRLEIEALLPTVLYFGYTLIMALLLFLVMSVVEFMSCFYFLWQIYSSVHID